MKTGILCHGRHLLATNWELHEWGNEKKNLLGQIPKTLLLVHQETPETIVFGTGASEKDGLKESEYILKYMFEHFGNLQNFSQFNGINLTELEKYMKGHSVVDKTSQNTYEEIKRTIEVFSSQDMHKMIIVSNPDHISRCMQMAHQSYHELKPSSLEAIFGAQSDIGYNGTAQITSKIIEIPHRGDDLSPDLSRYMGNYFKLPLEEKRQFVRMVEDFFDNQNSE